MAARIARHRAERPVIVAHRRGPWSPSGHSRALDGEADVVVVDCLNLWVANLLRKGQSYRTGDVIAEAAASRRHPAPARYSLILVSNEVGWGIHPGDGARPALPRRARLVNQARRAARRRGRADGRRMSDRGEIGRCLRRIGGSGIPLTVLERLIASSPWSPTSASPRRLVSGSTASTKPRGSLGRLEELVVRWS